MFICTYLCVRMQSADMYATVERPLDQILTYIEFFHVLCDVDCKESGHKFRLQEVKDEDDDSNDRTDQTYKQKFTSIHAQSLLCYSCLERCSGLDIALRRKFIQCKFSSSHTITWPNVHGVEQWFVSKRTCMHTYLCTYKHIYIDTPHKCMHTIHTCNTCILFITWWTKSYKSHDALVRLIPVLFKVRCQVK